MLGLTQKSGIALAAFAGAAALALGGCSSSDPLAAPSPTNSSSSASGPIVIGSQAYYSNEIVAEIYAQALEAKGFTVERKFNIGQRDAYIPSLESGEIQLFPEYTGNLLQFYKPDTTATTAADVYAALQTALPAGLEVLDHPRQLGVGGCTEKGEQRRQKSHRDDPSFFPVIQGNDMVFVPRREPSPRSIPGGGRWFQKSRARARY